MCIIISEHLDLCEVQAKNQDQNRNIKVNNFQKSVELSYLYHEMENMLAMFEPLKTTRNEVSKFENRFSRNFD